MKKQATIYDIAVSLGVNASTVSRALRNHPDISDETKKMVAAASRKLKYRHNLAASILRTGRSRTIGVVVPEINNHFFSNVIAGIEQVAHRHNYNIIICQTNEDYAKEVESVKTLMEQHVAAIIISLSKNTENTSHLKEVIRHKIPLIQFDRTDATLKGLQVLNDNVAATTDAVRHLHEQGYRSIAFLGGPKQINIFAERLEGFKKGLKAMGLSYNRSFVAFDCLTQEKARQVVSKLLQQKPAPDAVLACADMAALGALDAAKELGKKVPQQLGICGFSNEPYTRLTSPGITSINQFSQEMGKKAMELFIENQYGEDAGKTEQKLVVTTRLIPRESTMRKPARP